MPFTLDMNEYLSIFTAELLGLVKLVGLLVG